MCVLRIQNYHLHMHTPQSERAHLFGENTQTTTRHTRTHKFWNSRMPKRTHWNANKVMSLYGTQTLNWWSQDMRIMQFRSPFFLLSALSLFLSRILSVHGSFRILLCCWWRFFAAAAAIAVPWTRVVAVCICEIWNSSKIFCMGRNAHSTHNILRFSNQSSSCAL